MERSSSDLSMPKVFSDISTPSLSSRSTTPDLGIVDTTPERPKPVKRICCVGAGYVGGPTAAVIALKNPDIHISVVDLNESRIQSWNSRHLPVHEPGLDIVVRVARDGIKQTMQRNPCRDDFALPAREPNLVFSTDVQAHVAKADIVFISVNTPTKSSGIGAGSATDLSAFESAITAVAQYLKPGAILVEKSTVPCGTAQLIRDILSTFRPTEWFEVLSNPEFLAEGTAVADLLNPDRILIGSSNTSAGHAAAETLKCVYTSWVDASKILTVNIWSSELAKLVANAMLAQRISSINTISAICDRTGADVDEIAMAVGRDSRLGPKFLQAGVGFGGSCFRKDILNLVYLARSLYLPEVAEYWMSVLNINDFQMERFTRRVVERLNGALTRKKITVLGFTFKQDTNDTRESPAINVIRAIMTERPAEIAVFDPGCSMAEITGAIRSNTAANDLDVQPAGPVRPYDNAYDACAGSSAVLILTPWEQFRSHQASDDIVADQPQMIETAHCPLGTSYKSQPVAIPTDSLADGPACAPGCALCLSSSQSQATKAHLPLDWSLVAGTMKEPRWIFDGRNIVNRKAMEPLGFRVENLGKPVMR